MNKNLLILALFLPLTIAMCSEKAIKTDRNSSNDTPGASTKNSMSAKDSIKPENKEIAIFAGGCFWCMEQPFEAIEGVGEVVSGYCGGKEKNPSYQEVAHGETGHAEAVQVVYDKTKVNYQQLLTVFWHNINPVQKQGQFFDRGPQYRTEIFYLSDEQKKMAEQSKKDLENSKKFSDPIAVRISRATEFWPAEEYHQDYYLKNPQDYYRYKKGSGREDYIKETWGK